MLQGCEIDKLGCKVIQLDGLCNGCTKGGALGSPQLSVVALVLNMEKENYFRRKCIEILIFSKMEQEAP